MPKYHQNTFQPLHPEKYIGTKVIYYRSSWELTFMRFCDQNPSILEWASEPFKIPYHNPLTQKNTVYVPDFLIRYKDKTGNILIEIIEIKPEKQATVESAKKERDKLALAVNAMKWQAATNYALNNGMKFRVLTEKDIFR